MLLSIIADVEAVARTQLALFDTHGHDVPDLRPVLRRLDAGDIGDFTAATARAYERARRRADDDTQTMDFVETHVGKILAMVHRILAAAQSTLWSIVGEIDDYLRRVAVDHWRTSPFDVMAVLEEFTRRLHALGDQTIEWMTLMAQTVEEWIDVLRTLGPTPSPHQQLTARAQRIESIMKDLPVNDDGTIRGGMPRLLEHILGRGGDLLVGDVHPDPSLKLWLADHMDELHRNGVRVLMVERKRRFEQRNIDDFLATGRTAELKAALLPGVWGEKAVDADVALMAAARRNGIRIVAMDTAIAQVTGDELASGRFPVSTPFWAAIYQQERDALPPDQRILAVGGSGHSRTVGGFEGYFQNVYSIDQYDPPEHSRIGVNLSPGQAAVHPSQPFPSPTNDGEPWSTVLRRDNSDFIGFRPAQ